jgi:hypothetical protein
MALFQVTITKDQDWNAVNELFSQEYLHYVDLNVKTQPHMLLYADVLRRCD